MLVPGGAVPAIEVDYSTCRAEPMTPALEALIRAMVQGMAASGWSDAGTRLPGWLRQAGFREVDEGERPFWWHEDLRGQALYAADVLGALEASSRNCPASSGAAAGPGLDDLRSLPSQPQPGLGWVMRESRAVRLASSPPASDDFGSTYRPAV